MLVTLGWMLLAGLPLPRPATIDTTPPAAHRPAAGRVTVWTDRDEPYRRGEGARVYLSVDEPSYVTVFRVDTDGRLRVLFPREPWTDTYVRGQDASSRSPGDRGGRSFLVDDDPGRGIPLRHRRRRAVRLPRHHPRRLLGLPPHRRRPHPGRSLRARSPTWPPGSRPTGTTTTTSRRTTWTNATTTPASSATTAMPTPATTSGTPTAPRAPAIGSSSGTTRATTRIATAAATSWPTARPIQVRASCFATPIPAVRRVSRGEPERRRGDDDPGRTSEDVGGRGAVPAPRVPSLRTRDREPTPELSPARPLIDERRRVERRREQARERDDSRWRRRLRASVRRRRRRGAPASRSCAAAAPEPAAILRSYVPTPCEPFRMPSLLGLALAAGPLRAQTAPPRDAGRRDHHRGRRRAAHRRHRRRLDAGPRHAEPRARADRAVRRGPVPRVRLASGRRQRRLVPALSHHAPAVRAGERRASCSRPGGVEATPRFDRTRALCPGGGAGDAGRGPGRAGGRHARSRRRGPDGAPRQGGALRRRPRTLRRARDHPGDARAPAGGAEGGRCWSPNLEPETFAARIPPRHARADRRWTSGS